MANRERDDKIELEGIVIESSKGIFKVEVSENLIVNCSLSGRLRINDIRVLVADKVKIEVSPYDMTRGRIVQRFKLDQR